MILRFGDIQKIQSEMVGRGIMTDENNLNFILTGSIENCEKRFREINNFFNDFQQIYSQSRDRKTDIDRILNICVQEKYNNGKTWNDIISESSPVPSSKPLFLEDRGSDDDPIPEDDSISEDTPRRRRRRTGRKKRRKKSSGRNRSDAPSLDAPSLDDPD